MAKKAKNKNKAPAKKPRAHTKGGGVRPIVVQVNPTHKPKAKGKKNPISKPRLNANWLYNTGKEAAISAVFAYGGMLATREIPQMVLGAGNTGNKGLMANLGSGLAVTALAAFFSPKAAIAVATGAALGVAQRYMSERVMPVAAVANSEASGIGDVFTVAAARDSRRLIDRNHPAARRFVAGSTSGNLRTMAA